MKGRGYQVCGSRSQLTRNQHIKNNALEELSLKIHLKEGITELARHSMYKTEKAAFTLYIYFKNPVSND